MLDEVLSPERVVSHRIVVAEGLRFPKLHDWFFEHGVATPWPCSPSTFCAKASTDARFSWITPSRHPIGPTWCVFDDTILHSVCGRITREDIEHMRAEVLHAVNIFLRRILPGPRSVSLCCVAA